MVLPQGLPTMSFMLFSFFSWQDLASSFYKNLPKPRFFLTHSVPGSVVGENVIGPRVDKGNPGLEPDGHPTMGLLGSCHGSMKPQKIGEWPSSFLGNSKASFDHGAFGEFWGNSKFDGMGFNPIKLKNPPVEMMSKIFFRHGNRSVLKIRGVPR